MFKNMLCLLAILTSAASAAAQATAPVAAPSRTTSSLADLQRAARLPAWCAATVITVPDEKPWMPMQESSRSAAGMKASAGRLRYLIEDQTKSINDPFWTLQLGRHLADLNEDASAWQMLGSLLPLPQGTAMNPKLNAFADLATLKREARFYRARVLARCGLKAEARQELVAATPGAPYDFLRQAEVLVLLGEWREAEQGLTRASGSSHPDRGFSDVMLRMRAASLARAIGNDALVRQIAQPIISQAMTAQKWPQWQSAWSILKALDDQAAGGPVPTVAKLRPGVYSGACRGFDAPIEVRVRVAEGRMAEITVTSEQESRPWSALAVVPARIVRKQDLAVDAVTGATVTSCALMAAVDQAMGKAAATGASK